MFIKTKLNNCFNFNSKRYASSKAKKVTKVLKEIPTTLPVKTPAVKQPIEPKKGLFGRLFTSTTTIGSTVKNNLSKSQTTSSFKSLCKTCTTLKTNFKNFLWSILVLFKIDKYFTPKVLFVFRALGFTMKWLTRSFTLFNLVMLSWIVYFNTPTVTAKVITTWLFEFFRVLKITYTDTVAKFLDYVLSAANNGLKSVPKHPESLMDLPEAKMYQQYREVFKVLKDLTPKPDYLGETKPRWYDFMRDRADFKIYDPINKET